MVNKTILSFVDSLVGKGIYFSHLRQPEPPQLNNKWSTSTYTVFLILWKLWQITLKNNNQLITNHAKYDSVQHGVQI